MSEELKVTLSQCRGKSPLPVKPIGTALLLVLALFGRALMADECFCLKDQDDNFRHSCQTQQQGIRTVTHCRDDAGEPYTLNDLSGWTKLPASEGRCHPCQQGKIPVKEGPIRGGDDQQPSQDSADDRPE